MRFVIVASPRTGSSHLVSLLSAHPDILCNGNSLHPKHMWLSWPKKDLTKSVKAELAELRERDPNAFLERLYTAGFGRSHVGLKIFDKQNNAALRKLLANSEIRKILLYRKNVLANYSSRLAARSNNEWSVKEGRPVSPPPAVRFDEEEFIRFHDRYVSFYQDVLGRLSHHRQPFHFIEYLDINEPFLFAGLVSFIGADPAKLDSPAPLRARQAKQNSPDIVSRFLNASDVVNFLERYGLEHWSREGETSITAIDAKQGNQPVPPDPALHDPESVKTAEVH
jgi:LPS sulfotransferase NodH